MYFVASPEKYSTLYYWALPRPICHCPRGRQSYLHRGIDLLARWLLCYGATPTREYLQKYLSFAHVSIFARRLKEVTAFGTQRSDNTLRRCYFLLPWKSSRCKLLFSFQWLHELQRSDSWCDNGTRQIAPNHSTGPGWPRWGEVPVRSTKEHKWSAPTLATACSLQINYQLYTTSWLWTALWKPRFKHFAVRHLGFCNQKGHKRAQNEFKAFSTSWSIVVWMDQHLPN